VLDGFKMQNAGGETCGGTLANAFATSCDTTFAPLGAQLGGPKLVAMAKRFGFDRPTGIAGALESTIPQADQIGSPVAVGASAIGQGLVQASTLEMADVAATIADSGRRPLPTMLYGARTRFVHVTSPKIAGEVQGMMEAVVSEGTGTTAQIPGITVAGKTGTAELRDTAGKKNEAKFTDAWFVGYAPVPDPKVVVAALFPNSGYGADTAAPVVRQLIEDALGIS
jgi:peptidoglycan glycosyltransferase